MIQRWKINMMFPIRKLAGFVIVILFVITYLVMVRSTETCRPGLNVRRAAFTAFQSYRLSNHTIAKIPRTSSRLRCVLRCLSHPQCSSVNYLINLHECHFNNGTMSAHPEDMLEDANYDHFVLVDACNSNQHSVPTTYELLSATPRNSPSPVENIPNSDIVDISTQDPRTSEELASETVTLGDASTQDSSTTTGWETPADFILKRTVSNTSTRNAVTTVKIRSEITTVVNVSPLDQSENEIATSTKSIKNTSAHEISTIVDASNTAMASVRQLTPKTLRAFDTSTQSVLTVADSISQTVALANVSSRDASTVATTFAEAATTLNISIQDASTSAKITTTTQHDITDILTMTNHMNTNLKNQALTEYLTSLHMTSSLDIPTASLATQTSTIPDVTTSVATTAGTTTLPQTTIVDTSNTPMSTLTQLTLKINTRDSSTQSVLTLANSMLKTYTLANASPRETSSEAAPTVMSTQDASTSAEITTKTPKVITKTLTMTNHMTTISKNEGLTEQLASLNMTSSLDITTEPSQTASLTTQVSTIPGVTTNLATTAVPTSPPVTCCRSCQAWKEVGNTTDGMYEIDPDGPNNGVDPFTISCIMGTGATLIHHDKEATQQVSGYEAPGSYVVDLTYEVSVPQIIALTEVSTNCKQRVKLRCWMAAIWYGGVLHSWWVSRDGQKMENWGTPTGTSSCPCGLVGDCGLYKCDCDWNLIQWNQDEGDLTDKSTLPVKQLRLGETGNLGEKVKYTVGPLECFG